MISTEATVILSGGVQNGWIWLGVEVQIRAANVLCSIQFCYMLGTDPTTLAYYLN